MATVVVITQGTLVEARSNHLRTITPEGLRRDLPLAGMDRLWIFGKVQVTTRAIHLLARDGKELAYFSRRGRLRARLVVNPSHGVALRRAQYRAAESGSGLAWAATAISAKIRNQRAVLVRARRSHPNPSLNELFDRLEAAAERAHHERDGEALRGIEGSASRSYLAAWAALMANRFPWPGRIRRPPTDPLNALLSFLGTMLVNDVQAQIEALGLDPWCGFHHAERAGAPALALDLAEPFRPILVDRLILDLVGHGTLDPQHFTTQPTGAANRDPGSHQDADEAAATGGTRLTDTGLKIVLTAYERRMHDPDEEDGSTRGVRVRLRHTLENFAASLRAGNPADFAPERLRT